MKIKLKKLWRLYPVVLILGILLFFHIKGSKNRNTFYNKQLNEKIVSSTNWQVRVKTYFLESNIAINSTMSNPIDLQIGDSITKKSNTNTFNVFRKEKGKYEYYKTFEFGH